jgi:hypothetical protein
VWLGVGSDKIALPRPTHQRVTPTVGQRPVIWVEDKYNNLNQQRAIVVKKKRIIISTVLLTTLLSCLATYRVFPLATYQIFPQAASAWWAITSVVEVPVCTARVADKLGIEADFSVVKDHIIRSLQPGMTPEEVENTLSKISPVYVKQSFIDEKQETNSELLIRLCDNPFGNVVLFVYYSQDGHLLHAVDAYEE